MRVLLIAALLTGCAVDVTPAATGGSRADGTVTFSYTYGSLTRPRINWDSTLSEAVSRCNSWGYTSATAFSPEPSVCVFESDNMGCTRYQVTRTYQCSD